MAGLCVDGKVNKHKLRELEADVQNDDWARMRGLVGSSPCGCDPLTAIDTTTINKDIYF